MYDVCGDNKSTLVGRIPLWVGLVVVGDGAGAVEIGRGWRLVVGSCVRLELVVEENVVCAVFPRERDDGAVWHTEVWLLFEVGRDALLVELMH